MPSQKKRPVTLTVADREELVRITMTGVHAASMIRRARVLLALDNSVGAVDPEEVLAARLEVSRDLAAGREAVLRYRWRRARHDRSEEDGPSSGALAGHW